MEISFDLVLKGRCLIVESVQVAQDLNIASISWPLTFLPQVQRPSGILQFIRQNLNTFKTADAILLRVCHA